MISDMGRQTYDPVNKPTTGAELFDRFARFYDGDYRDYDDDVDLILGLAAESGGPILELGCGTGRVVLPLAGAGHRVTGVDISPKLLMLAREKAGRQHFKNPPEFVQDDMVSFDLPCKDFRLAICTSNTLMHLTTAQQQLAALQNAGRHLARGGWLFLSLFNPDVARLVAVDGLVELADEWADTALGARVVKWSVRRVDFAEQLQDTLFIYEECGADGLVTRTLCPFQLRYLWRHEAELMLRQCGFVVEAVWGGFDDEPYTAESEYLVLLGRKL
jgi:SAM-dependent methyltransferase